MKLSFLHSKSVIVLALLPVLLSGALWSQGAAEPGAQVPGSVEERRLLYDLEQKRQELENAYSKKEEKLSQREIELKTLEQEVDTKLVELKQLREEVEALLKKKDTEELLRVKGLSKMYEKMDSSKAAKLLADLDRKLAVSILSGMKPKTAGKILNDMKSENAAQLSSDYSALKAGK